MEHLERKVLFSQSLTQVDRFSFFYLVKLLLLLLGRPNLGEALVTDIIIDGSTRRKEAHKFEELRL